MMNHVKTCGRRVLAAAFVVMVAGVLLAPVGTAVAQTDPFLELLRKDIQADKVMLLTAALGLTEEQDAKFWPLYREYEVELAKLGDARIALIKDYAQSYDTMTEEKAAALAKESFKLQGARLKLLQKTHGKVAKEIGPILATRFAQVENQLLLLIDFQVASELPLIRE
jgi:hypothetical protein